MYFTSDIGNGSSGAIGGSLTTMKHVKILQGTDDYFEKAIFLEACQKATAIHVNVHGSPTTLGPFAPVTSTLVATASNISAAVSKRGTNPPINVVFAAACSTLEGDARDLPTAFGIQDGVTDRAYVGFDAFASAGFQTVESFWSELALGKTVAAARSTAQAFYNDDNIGRNPNTGVTGPNPANLVIVGDGSTTLKSRYVDQVVSPWWKLF